MNKNYWIMLVASFVLMSGVCIAESITGDCDLSLSESAATIASSGFVLGFFRSHFAQVGSSGCSTVASR